ncbi:SDR family NAD(P)-dependent oxidoreductase [Streptomyces sp. NPDC127110]|uniref:SDR family NAD(P)-dependent oxidoreductase n=1 Tax=Streptomyces sp. NPDC127110 TaxID=3345362 RepID=UPI00362AEEF5
MTGAFAGRGADLTGQVAVITGGSAGLGHAIAEGLSAAGCAVVPAGRREEACRRAAARIAGRTGAPPWDWPAT